MKPFVVSIPPANVTGKLHLGHAMFVAMEDLMIRYHRMKGIPSLWVPGVDHAGIATQLIGGTLPAGKEGLTREEMGREAFPGTYLGLERRIRRAYHQSDPPHGRFL